jgi:nucleoside-diphosphate-sugar epimerase
MRIFLTGATGYVGAAVLDALVKGGHDVTALVRDNHKAARLAGKGARPVVGDLADPESFRGVVDAQDGYIHTAFDSSRGPSVERAALDIIVAAAKRPRTAGSTAPAKRFVAYVGTLGARPHLGAGGGRFARQPAADRVVEARPRQFVLDAATDSLRAIVVRPGNVYGGGNGMIGDLLKDASNGLVRVVGDGSNRWPLIYDRDLADLYARLASREDAQGVFHANDEDDERVNDIVQAIAPYVAVRPDVRHMPIEEARSKMGPYADALALDQVVRSPRARALGWAPTLHSVAGNAARLLEEWRASRN